MLKDNFFKGVVENVVLRFWSHQEKEALVKIIHDIYLCDFDFSEAEVKDFNNKLAVLNVNPERMQELSVDDAINILQTDKMKKDLIYIILAEAIYKDDDYDKTERAYMEKFIQKYNIDKDRLNNKIKEIRDKKLDKVLKDWVREIEKGRYI